MPADISERDVEAYLDDLLDLEGRLAVETFFAKHPRAAADFMERRAANTALRLLGTAPWEPPGNIRIAAAQLAQRLESRHPKSRRPASRRVLAAGAAALAAMGGLFAIQSAGHAQPPAYVNEAIMSYRTGLLRAAMVSQPESLLLDPEEIQRNTRIHVPRLPAGWIVTDVQIFPSDMGPALQIMIRTTEHKDISIFAVRSASAAPAKPTATRHGDTSVAYWRKGEISYALTGMEAPEALDLAAEDLVLSRPS